MQLITFFLLLLFNSNFFLHTSAVQCDPSFNSALLARHNYYRALHSSTPPLTLNSNLTKVAQKWAEQILTTGVYRHRPNRRLSENLYRQVTDSEVSLSATVVVDSWYSENQLYAEFYGSEPDIDTFSSWRYFTALIWASSRELGVGCATRILENSPGKRITYVVTNYSPRGNVVREFTENVRPPKRQIYSSTTSTTKVPTSSLSYNKTSPTYTKTSKTLYSTTTTTSKPYKKPSPPSSTSTKYPPTTTTTTTTPAPTYKITTISTTTAKTTRKTPVFSITTKVYKTTTTKTPKTTKAYKTTAKTPVKYTTKTTTKTPVTTTTTSTLPPPSPSTEDYAYSYQPPLHYPINHLPNQNLYQNPYYQNHPFFPVHNYPLQPRPRPRPPAPPSIFSHEDLLDLYEAAYLKRPKPILRPQSYHMNYDDIRDLQISKNQHKKPESKPQFDYDPQNDVYNLSPYNQTKPNSTEYYTTSKPVFYVPTNYQQRPKPPPPSRLPFPFKPLPLSFLPPLPNFHYLPQPQLQPQQPFFRPSFYRPIYKPVQVLYKHQMTDKKVKSVGDKRDNKVNKVEPEDQKKSNQETAA